MISSEKDRHYMEAALRLADKVKGRTIPNPAVGAVIVKNNEIIATGATSAWGGHHAEKKALLKAGKKARGATLYVTLEPCCHYGKTPPCTDWIIDYGISRAVCACKDSNPQVNGKGIRTLRKAGIETACGIMKKEAVRLNEDFFFSVVTHQPWITLKLALTLDGKIADTHNRSKWITGPGSRKFVHELRRKHAAVAVGGTTAALDDPELTVRHRKGFSPARIVFSQGCNLDCQSRLALGARQYRTIVTGTSASTDAGIHLRDDGVEQWISAKPDADGIISDILDMAWNERLHSIFIEGGSQIARKFLEMKLVNRIYIFYGAVILGSGISGIQLKPELGLENSIRLSSIETGIFGNDLMISGIPQYTW